MNKTSISKIAIFLNQSQLELLGKKSIDQTILDLFFNKLEALFPQVEILSNYNFNLQKNFQYINQTLELNFLFAVNDLLPPSNSKDPDFDEICFAYFLGICPMFSLDLTRELESRHTRYLAQYSYSENLPKGIVPYFLSREFVNSLPDNVPTTAHDYLIKNLNNYDTEIFFKEPDLRQFRLDFSLSDFRSLKLSEFFMKVNPNMEYRELFDNILANPNGFRLAPSYIEMELYHGCESACTFCPRQFISNENDTEKLSLSFITKFLNDLNQTFPYPITICLGGMGEPFLHPEFNEIIVAILDYPHLKELIVETALYVDINKFLETISSIGQNKTKLSLIVNLTTLNESKYKEIYQNKTNVKSVLDKISTIADTLGKSNIHLQIIKIKEIEEEIESYFTYFEKLGINVILQKYNSYAGLMPEKRVSDLTPIKRDFCWHLNRDLYITSDGSVTICKQELQNKIGNLHSDSIFSIWEKGMKTFSNSLHGNHDKINAPCLTCDEWYTFNV